MAQHIFDDRGRKIGTILNDDELPSGCSFKSILILALVLFVIYVVKVGPSYIDNLSPPENDVSMIIRMHEKAEEYGVGTVLSCPVCGENFTKKSMDFNCCSEKCEREYQELYRAWTSGNKEVVESYGKKFR